MNLKLILATMDGEVLDTIEDIEPAEFEQAQRSALGALSLIEGLMPGNLEGN